MAPTCQQSFRKFEFGKKIPASCLCFRESGQGSYTNIRGRKLLNLCRSSNGRSRVLLLLNTLRVRSRSDPAAIRLSIASVVAAITRDTLYKPQKSQKPPFLNFCEKTRPTSRTYPFRGPRRHNTGTHVDADRGAGKNAHTVFLTPQKTPRSD